MNIIYDLLESLARGEPSRADTVEAWYETHIERIAGVCGGQPVIRETRIRVTDVIQWLQWYSDIDIVSQFTPLTLDDITAARYFYFDHREELDSYIRLDQEAEQSLAESFAADTNASR